MSLASMGRLHLGLGQLLPRFLKAPLIARRVQNACCAAGAREQRLARNNDCHRHGCDRERQLQRIFHVACAPRIENRSFPRSELFVLLHPDITGSRYLRRGTARFPSSRALDRQARPSRSSLLARAAADGFMPRTQGSALENGVSAGFVRRRRVCSRWKTASLGGNVHVGIAAFRHQDC